MRNFTLDELAAFSEEEKQIVNDLLNEDPMTESSEVLMAPSHQSVKTVLAYSKAMSMRRSKKLDHINIVLN
jgi:hypothetical protein